LRGRADGRGSQTGGAAKLVHGTASGCGTGKVVEGGLAKQSW